jgi:hypothetical protein
LVLKVEFSGGVVRSRCWVLISVPARPRILFNREWTDLRARIYILIALLSLTSPCDYLAAVAYSGVSLFIPGKCETTPSQCVKELLILLILLMNIHE